MTETVTSSAGMVVAPHRAAAEAGAEILKAGGTALDAMIAAAATVAVVYPHMNGLGGDGFWLFAERGRPPRAIDAAGPAAKAATLRRYRDLGHDRVPTRGPDAALTVAGAVDGWRLAHEAARAAGGGLPLADLLAPAIAAAREGSAVTRSQAQLTAEKLAELKDQPGFAAMFLRDGEPPAIGDVLRQPRLADTLDHLARAGLRDLYRGDVAASAAADLARAGSPLARADLEAYEAKVVAPLFMPFRGGMAFNLPPPTQGLASLIILGLTDRMKPRDTKGAAFVHGIVEATKRAFLIRDRVVTDPTRATATPAAFLSGPALDAEAAAIDRRRAAKWPAKPAGGDTIWMGAIDRDGTAVSYIQSIFFEFGSGVVLPETGLLWQNRGAAFSLDPASPNVLEPGLRPFHTLNPALARLNDGRTVVYGTMGGEGQPQTQAQIFARAIFHEEEIGAAIAAPRWLLGRTWGSEVTALRFENRTDPDVIRALERMGHEIVVLDEAFSDTMGHAGMILREPSGELLGAHDPRADGGAAVG